MKQKRWDIIQEYALEWNKRSKLIGLQITSVNKLSPLNEWRIWVGKAVAPPKLILSVKAHYMGLSPEIRTAGDIEEYLDGEVSMLVNLLNAKEKKL